MRPQPGLDNQARRAATRTALPRRAPGYVQALSGHRRASLIGMMLDALTSNLERYMDLLSARQKLVASNVANADTPGYKAQDIDFQFEFMSLVNGQQPQTIQTQGLKVKSDGNNVDLDHEARLLAENAMRFNVASTLLRDKIKMVQQAIQGGSGA